MKILKSIATENKLADLLSTLTTWTPPGAWPTSKGRWPGNGWSRGLGKCGPPRATVATARRSAAPAMRRRWSSTCGIRGRCLMKRRGCRTTCTGTTMWRRGDTSKRTRSGWRVAGIGLGMWVEIHW